MSSLTLALNNALSGLNVSQQALVTLSQNISNANTPGYSRQIVNQQSLTIDGQGQGVSIASITRRIDEFLAGAQQQQNSVVGQTGVLSDYHSRLQILFGQPGSQNSIDSFTNSFFNNLQALAQTPQDTTLQQSVVNSGETLADQLSQLSSGLSALQLQADKDINDAVDAVNNDLTKLATINTAVINGRSLGHSTADLEDQRDTVVKDISQYMSVQTITRDNGSINLTINGGIPVFDENSYKLLYDPAGTVAAFTGDTPLSALSVQRVGNNGQPIGSATPLVTGGTASQRVDILSSGKILGLTQMRDQQIPDMLSQIDTLAATLRDQVNAIHNSGVGFPGATSLTGTRQVNAADYSQWTGKVRIAVLDSNGQPVLSPYGDENGLAPMTLDLSTLDSGQGQGNPSTQTIIDAINQYYGQPQQKVELGNLNNIQLMSDSNNLPGSPARLDFDFNLSNLSGTASNFYVTGATIKDNTAATVSSAALNIPSVTLASSNTYQTTNLNGVVTIATSGTNTLVNGQKIYLSTPPAGTYGGIDASDLGGFFIVSGVTNNSFQISTAGTGNGLSGDAFGQTAMPPYAQAGPGDTVRTSPAGTLSANLSSNPSSPYYDVTVDMVVDDGTGTLKNAQVTYRVSNQQSNTRNNAYAALSATGDATLVQPTTTQSLAKATLVDANGNELPKINGKYVTDVNGYLQIKTTSGSNVLAIDSLDSSEQGKPNTFPPQPGTNRGFSWYFDLNDFFRANQQTTSGDTIMGSALNMQVEQRLRNNPSLVALGQMAQTPQSIDPNAPPTYTYERAPGDNSVVQRLAALGSLNLNFPASGGLGLTTQSFSGYAGEIIGSAATNAANVKNNDINAQTLLDGYAKQSSAVSGVNLDTELANTVIYQNAYAASARMVTITNALFETLLNTFGG